MRVRLRGVSSAWAIGALAIGLSAALGGCGNESFVPPPPEGLRDLVAPPPPQGVSSVSKGEAGAKPIELILAPRDEDAGVSTAHFARTQAGYDGVLIHTTVPEAKTTAAGQADLVASIIKEKPPVLIVEPPEQTDSRLVELLNEARGKGTPVVIVGPALPGMKESTGPNGDDKLAALIRVESDSFDESASRLIASAQRVVKNARLDAKGHAILFYNKTGDPYITARITAIQKALTEAGITEQTTVTCDLNPEKAAEDLLEAIEKDPKVTMIFPFDYRTFTSTVKAIEMLENRDVVVAGYDSEEKDINIHSIPNMAAVAEFRPAKLIRRAVQLARSLMVGEKVIAVNPVAINFTDSAPSTGVPELRRAKTKATTDSDQEKPESEPKR